ncbi:MAG: hypothetical protein JSR67_03765 [Proteobacteria bacterium]|nr:hypothetical protein [Pseudomonadota bacterium]
MGGYIRMDKDLEDDPRVLALADAIGEAHGLARTQDDQPSPIARNAAMGALFRLWRHADTHIKRDNRLHAPLRMLVAVTGLSVTVLLSVSADWLVVHPDGTLELPDFAAKNVLMDKDNRRAKNRERQARHRAKMRENPRNSNGVTRHTGKRDKGVTTGTGPGTGTGTVPTVPGPGPEPVRSAAPLAAGPGAAAAPRKDPDFASTYRERFGSDPPPAIAAKAITA